METRADFVLIGTFTVSIIVGVFLFVLWLAQVEIDREWADYDIIFESTVTGLSESGDVRFSGIKVGEVKRLHIDPKDPSRVVARIRVDANTPVTMDSVATLEFQGLTGVAYILLEGGNAQSERIKLEEGQTVPRIIATPSAIQELFAGAPDVLTGTNQLLIQAQQVLGKKNRKHIENILLNIETVTGSVAKRSEDIDVLIANFRTISTDLAKISGQVGTMSENLSALSVNANQFLENDGRAIMSDARRSAAAMRSLTENANSLLEDNSGSIRAFADGGLAQFGLFVVESRQLVRSLDRVLERMESDPARYISGNYAAEYEAD